MLMQPSQSIELPLSARAPNRRRELLLCWAVLGAFFAANLPLMIAMPLTSDPITFDLQARAALEGGVLYRDLVEPNLPGVVWVHMAVRSVLGWSSTALRTFDLLVFAGIVLLLLRIARSARIDRNFPLQTPLLALVLCGFYFSTSEWCHCQRDIWQMLPALAALALRLRQVQRFSEGALGEPALLFWGILEGLLWGLAFWIKPFVAVPALAGFAVSAWWMKNLRASAFHLGGVLLGGMAAGACGSIWLIQTGAWPHFWDISLNWNPAYFEVGRERWTWRRYVSMSQRFLPWNLCHFIALPVAGKILLELRRRDEKDSSEVALSLLAAVYLGWLVQAHFFQHLLDYIHVPAVLLGMALIASAWPVERSLSQTAGRALAGALVLAVIVSPATSPERLSWWGRCLTEGSTPAVRDGLKHMPLPDWQELEQVADFLRTQNLKNRELTAYNVFTIHLYPELGQRPSTRFVFPEVHARIFTGRTDIIRKTLEDSPQRFVVSSLLENGLAPEYLGHCSPDSPPRLPDAFPPEERKCFPYNQTLVFRAGQYVVHEVTGPVGPLNTRFFSLERPVRSGNH